MNITRIRTRWAAVGAAVAVTLGAGGIGFVSATSPADAVTYVPITPCRAADTRPAPGNIGPRSTPIGAAETHVVNSNDGECAGEVPATATGLQLNVTALGATEVSFMTIWPSGVRPQASSLNPTPGQPPVPNAVTTGVTGAGDFNIYNFAGNVNTIVDIVGYYTDHDHDDRYYTEDEVNALTVRNPVAVATSTSSFNYDEGAQNTWQEVISTSITIPAGFTATLEASFGGESTCYGTLDDYCSVRILSDATSMDPAEDASNAFDSTDSGTADSGDYEETSITRTLTLPAGTYAIAVEALTFNGAIDMRLDDLILFVEGHLAPA